MGYLDQLKDICAQMTEVATDKDQIDRCAALSNTIKSLEDENSTMLKNYNELKSAYKDAVMNNSFSKTEPKNDIDKSGQAPDFDSMLKEFLAQKK